MRVVMGWEAYLQLYTYLRGLAETCTFIYEVRATPVRALVEFYFPADGNDKQVYEGIEHYVYTHLA